jgi:hypothetical protein
MTSASLSRRLVLLAAVASSLALGACKVGGGGGSGGSGGQANIRALNLTSNLPSLDFYIGGNKQPFSPLATGVLAPTYTGLDANSYAFNINSAGNSTALFTGTYSLAGGQHYTAVVWGPQNALHVSTLSEDEDISTIVAGNTRVRVFNATTETGNLDVYLTAPGADLTATAPTFSVNSGILTGFREIPASATYELRVTGLNSPGDLRLDIPSITLGASQVSTLVFTAGSGGVLVHGLQFVQQGAATALPNTKARLRVVSSVNNAGTVTADAGTGAGLVHLTTALRSPAIGPYTLVDAGGSVNLSVSVGALPVLSGPQSYAAGADYTLLTYGDPATPATLAVTTITDDNRLPLNAGTTKIRVINGVLGLGNVTLQVDASVPTSFVPVDSGSASPYYLFTSSTGAFIQVTPDGPDDVYTTTRPNLDPLVSQGVYTVFILAGRPSLVPFGQLRRERP